MPSSLAATRRRPARTSSRKPTNRLGAYLAAGLGATTGITATSDAAIVTIDITNLPGSGANISGVNGGVAVGGVLTINDWLGANSGTVEIYNNNN